MLQGGEPGRQRAGRRVHAALTRGIREELRDSLESWFQGKHTRARAEERARPRSGFLPSHFDYWIPMFNKVYI